MTLLNNQIQHLRKENQLLKQRLDSLVHSDINKTLEENIILNDLFLNAQNKNSKNKDCKPETINLALQIKLVSSKAYEILANNLPFPSSSYIDERFRDSISDIPQKITDLKGINDIINMLTKKIFLSFFKISIIISNISRFKLEQNNQGKFCLSNSTLWFTI